MMNVKSGLYVITCEELSGGRSTLEVVQKSLEGGASIIQLREKDWSAAKLIAVGRELRRLTRSMGAALIINDRVDLALALEADGVHVGQQDMPLTMVRRLAGPDMIVGVSAGDPAEARAAERDGASYIGVGPMFPTDTKKDTRSVRSVEMLGEIRQACGLPIFAIGGIKIEHTARVIRAGADGVAVITGVTGAIDIAGAARAFVEEIKVNKHIRLTKEE